MLILNQKNIADPKIFAKISKEAQQCDHFNYVGEYGVKAYQIILSIDEALNKNPQLKTEDPELYQEYKNLSVFLKFNNLERLPEDNNILDLIEKKVAYAFKKEINLEIKLRNAIMSKGIILRDNFISQILAALKKNQEKIGSQDIIISGKKVEPTIQNWIKDYEYTSEPGIHSLVERNNYFIHSKNVRNLKEKERKEIKQLLQLYDKLHLKVTDVGGLGTYPLEMYKIKLKKPVAIENFIVKEQEKVARSVQEPSSTVKPIPFPSKTEIEKEKKRARILAENKKEAEKAMQGAVDIKKLEAQKPANRLIASLKGIGRPRKKIIKKLVSKQKIVKAMPEKEVLKATEKPRTKPIPAQNYFKKQVKSEIKSKIIEPEIPLKTFHKEKKKVLAPSKPISKELNKIQNITLEDFKNLGQNAKQCAQALLIKIRTIAKTHDERAIARENFLKSPLYKIYEAMENQSQSEKKSISQIAEDRKKQNIEFLTEDEYIAVKSVSKLI